MLFALLCFVVFLYIEKNRHKEITDLQVSESDVKYDINVSYDGTHYIISGWCMKPGESIWEVDLSLILWDKEAGKGFQFPTVLCQRPDVTEVMKDGNYYDYSGFTSTIEKSALKNKKYEIYFLYRNDGNDITVATGKMIGE